MHQIRVVNYNLEAMSLIKFCVQKLCRYKNKEYLDFVDFGKCLKDKSESEFSQGHCTNS